MENPVSYNLSLGVSLSQGHHYLPCVAPAHLKIAMQTSPQFCEHVDNVRRTLHFCDSTLEPWTDPILICFAQQASQLPKSGGLYSQSIRITKYNEDDVLDDALHPLIVFQEKTFAPILTAPEWPELLADHPHALRRVEDYWLPQTSGHIVPEQLKLFWDQQLALNETSLKSLKPCLETFWSGHEICQQIEAYNDHMVSTTNNVYINR